MLLVSALLLSKSLFNIWHADGALDAAGISAVEVRLPTELYPEPWRRAQFFAGVLHGLGVSGEPMSAVASALPGQGESSVERLSVPGSVAADQPLVNVRLVSPGYFKLLGIPRVDGTTVTDDGRRGDTAIVSAGLADLLWPGRPSDGETLIVGGRAPLVVSGVVADTRSIRLDREPGLMIYRPYQDTPPLRMFVLVRSVLSASPGRLIRELVVQREPSAVIGPVEELSTTLADTMSPRRAQLFVALITAWASVLVLALGVYASAVNAVLSRRREIAVRIACGATPAGVRSTIVGDGLRPIVIGGAAGLLMSVLAGQWLSSMLFGVEPYDPTILALSLGVLLAVATAALYGPVRVASRTDARELLSTR